MISNVIVRCAVQDDFPDILNMIQELADFEDMPNGPQLKLNDLLRDGGFLNSESDRAPLFFCFVAEVQECTTTQTSNDAIELLTRKIIGYSLCFFTYSTWQGKTMFMEDIYVQPQYRDKGVGKQIFKKVIDSARKANCMRLDFHVLKWNPATDFYKKFGAINLTENEEWQFYRLKLDAHK